MPEAPDIRAHRGKGNPIPLGDGRHKSGRSGSGNACVSWRFAGGKVFLSHSARPGEELEFTMGEWLAFLGGVADGDPYP